MSKPYSVPLFVYLFNLFVSGGRSYVNHCKNKKFKNLKKQTNFDSTQIQIFSFQYNIALTRKMLSLFQHSALPCSFSSRSCSVFVKISWKRMSSDYFQSHCSLTIFEIEESKVYKTERVLQNFVMFKQNVGFLRNRELYIIDVFLNFLIHC